MLRVDTRADPLAADSLDGLVSFSVAIDRMRQDEDLHTIPDRMRDHTRQAFAALDGASRDLAMIAAGSTDLLYRQIMSLTQLDQYTLAFASTAVREFFVQLAERQVRTFYILDNSLRQDRFLAVMRLLSEAGVQPFSPHTHGTEWEPIANMIRSTLSGGHAHAAYVEPDALANHLSAAVSLAKQSGAVATFRNEAPENTSFQILSLGVAVGAA